MSHCVKNINGDHRLEFRDCTEGMSKWVCLDCGETELQLEDCGSGGG